jgi:predicted dienelactone hydrolase
VLERPKDITFAIDRAIEWNKKDKALKGKIDTEKIALMGHSYGAHTTLVACGARPILDHLKPPVKPGKGLAEDLGDPRITFGIAMSPQGPGGVFFGEESYKTISKPLVCISGTKDGQKGLKGGPGLPADNRMKAFELMPAGDKHMLWLKNADHMSFSGEPTTGGPLPSPSRPDGIRISRAAMVLFCDHYLKKKEEAKEHITEKYFNTLCGDVVTSLKLIEK